MARPRSDISERILKAARKRFLKDGVEGASLRALAKDAGTSIGMVYYYYPTKDDLFMALVEQTYVRVLDDLAKALAPDVPVRERMARLFERISALDEHELVIVRLVIREVLTSPKRRDRLIERFQRGHIALLARTISDGILEGAFDPTLHPFVLMASTAALGTVPQIVRRVAGERLPFTDAPEGVELSRKLVQVLFDGIGRPTSRKA
jgi:AcrR family transcriptional regulator